MYWLWSGHAVFPVSLQQWPAQLMDRTDASHWNTWPDPVGHSWYDVSWGTQSVPSHLVVRADRTIWFWNRTWSSDLAHVLSNINISIWPGSHSLEAVMVLKYKQKTPPCLRQGGQKLQAWWDHVPDGTLDQLWRCDYWLILHLIFKMNIDKT